MGLRTEDFLGRSSGQFGLKPPRQSWNRTGRIFLARFLNLSPTFPIVGRPLDRRPPIIIAP